MISRPQVPYTMSNVFDTPSLSMRLIVVHGTAPQHDERLMKCLRYSRAVRVLAVLSGIMVIYGASAFT